MKLLRRVFLAFLFSPYLATAQAPATTPATAAPGQKSGAPASASQAGAGIAEDPAAAQARDAFIFTDYNLAANIQPREQSIEVRGRLTLYNSSSRPQEKVYLQISSPLRWATVRAEGKTLTFAQSRLRSDVDHTGWVNEAAVSLPAALQPRQSIELEVAYRGQVLESGERLEELGTPPAVAAHTDYDRITQNFTLLRGMGHVLWFPAAIAPATLAQGNEVFREIGEWKSRHALSRMRLAISVSGPDQAIITNGDRAEERERAPEAGTLKQTVTWSRFGIAGPMVVIGSYGAAPGKMAVEYLPEHRAEAIQYAAVIRDFEPPVSGAQKRTAVFVDLPSNEDQPFDGGSVFLLPLKIMERGQFELLAAYVWAHATAPSPRAWISEGVAHYAQALTRERQEGRKAALQFMGQRLSALTVVEPDVAALSEANAQNAGQSLINATDEIYYRTKAMYVWWMLREMLGEAAVSSAIERYKPEEDKSAAYMQKLLEAESHKDLEWFFDDWVYRDRGLPELKLNNVYARESLRGAFLVTTTIENTGAAAVEAPIIVTTAGGDVNSRLRVPGKSKAVSRVEVGSKPLSVTVNDGSVPETDMSDNAATIRLPGQN